MALGLKIFPVLIGLVLLKLLATANGQYATIGEKYYRPITTEKANWYKANQICSMLGMQLASIETESDLNALKNYLFSNSLLASSFWLAGNNLADHGDYVWISTGRRFSYTKWSPSQPGTSANRCVRTDSNFDWLSDSCKNAYYFICQKPLVPDCGIYGGCTPTLSYLY